MNQIDDCPNLGTVFPKSPMAIVPRRRPPANETSNITLCVTSMGTCSAYKDKQEKKGKGKGTEITHELEHVSVYVTLSLWCCMSVLAMATGNIQSESLHRIIEIAKLAKRLTQVSPRTVEMMSIRIFMSVAKVES